MIALICFVIPPLILWFIRERLLPKQEMAYQRILHYIVGAIILNFVMWVIIYTFFTNGNHLFYNLNHKMVFAIKYFALASAFAIVEPLLEKLFRLVVSKVYHCLNPMIEKIWGRSSKTMKTIGFLIIVMSLICGFCFVAQPIWISENNYNTTHGFYEEPRNTIETIFLGPSAVIYGINPIDLYDNYGICSYNFGTSNQPMMASYYWLEEAHRLNSETLDTVVLDISSLRRTVKESWYHMAFDAMRFSSVKIRAVKAYSDNFDDFLTNLIPIISYHNRLSSITSTDVLKIGYEPELSSRGYYFSATQYINNVDDYESIKIPLYIAEENTEEKKLNTESLFYLEKIIAFCDDNDIKLVLTKLPANWSAEEHNMVQNIAQNYGLDFLDFNIDPYCQEIDINYALDTVDNAHLNFYGATKLTNYLGEYLIQNCGNRDIRKDSRFTFLKDESKKFHECLILTNLYSFTDPCQYLECALTQDDFAIFISVKDEAAGSLTEKQREYFSSIGLTKLSELTYRASYLAVIDSGQVVVELTEKDPPQEEDSDVIDDLENIEELYEQEKREEDEEETSESLELSYESVLSDWTKYYIASGGYNLGNFSSILIGDFDKDNLTEDDELSPNTRGLNIVVYDKDRNEIIDTVAFDTCAAPEIESRDYGTELEKLLKNGATYEDLTGKERMLYQYDRACINYKVVAEATSGESGSNLFSYLKPFMNRKEYTIYIAVKGDANNILTADMRKEFNDFGLLELASIEVGDSYISVIKGDTVINEDKSNEKEPIKTVIGDASIVSGGFESGDIASIKIDGTEYSQDKDGINVVIIDNYTGQYVDSVVFKAEE